MADRSPPNDEAEFAYLISHIKCAVAELDAATVRLRLEERVAERRFPELAAMIDLAASRLSHINDHVDRLFPALRLPALRGHALIRRRMK